MSKRRLKLYVWDGSGVLTDYTDGMICVLAYDYEHAIRLIQEKAPWSMQSFPHLQYKIVEKPEAFICHGGS